MQACVVKWLAHSNSLFITLADIFLTDGSAESRSIQSDTTPTIWLLIAPDDRVCNTCPGSMGGCKDPSEFLLFPSLGLYDGSVRGATIKSKPKLSACCKESKQGCLSEAPGHICRGYHLLTWTEYSTFALYGTKTPAKRASAKSWRLPSGMFCWVSSENRTDTNVQR